MRDTNLDSIVKLAKDGGLVFLATADKTGMPHIAAVGKIALDSNSRIKLDEWLCPQTVENLDSNRNACLAVWRPETNDGFQLTGRILSMHDLAMMNGYARELETMPPPPQIERELLFECESVYEFRHGIHSDSPAIEGAV